MSEILLGSVDGLPLTLERSGVVASCTSLGKRSHRCARKPTSAYQQGVDRNVAKADRMPVILCIHTGQAIMC